jgi:hypothetical protein
MGPMRILFVTLLLAGCGSGSTNNGDGGGGGGGDSSVPQDLMPPGDAFLCGNTWCTGGTVCCVTGMTPTCMNGCPDGGFVAACKGPENCSGNPCCITNGSGFSIHDVTCGTAQTSCPPNVDAMSGTGQDRACHTNADCTSGAPGTNLPDCCTNTSTGQHVCFNSGLVGLVSGFTCP